MRKTSTDLIELERLILSSWGEAVHCSCLSLSACLWRLLARACWMELVTQSRESRLLAVRMLLPCNKQTSLEVKYFLTLTR